VEPPTTRLRRPASTPRQSVERIEKPVIRRNLSFLPFFGILFAADCSLLFFQAGLMDFRSGAGTYGLGGGVSPLFVRSMALDTSATRSCKWLASPTAGDGRELS